MNRLVACVALIFVAACPAVMAPGAVEPAPGRADPSTEPGSPSSPEAPEAPAPPPRISWQRVADPDDVPASPPPPGTWRVHMIDVGTGLAILVQGADFTLLFDAGSNDPAERPSRVVAYLAAALGPSGDAQCGAHATAAGAAPRRTLDHVFLSHPHQDHASALELVLHCFAAHDIWDAGRVNDAVFYRDFLHAVADAAGATYHTAAPPPADRTVVVKGLAVTIPATVIWATFSEGDEVPLGAAARLTILHAEAKRHSDPNANSIVVVLALGGARVLLTGDAESGPRADPAAALGDVEAHLVDHFAAALDADVLQVGHHGSLTSSRRAFLDAVSPSLALISAGPRAYHGTTLPDAAVVAALGAVGATVLRTDEHDGACPAARRLGAPTGPGGCDSWIVTIESAAANPR